MKAVVFSLDTCSNTSVPLIDQLFKPLYEVRMVAKIVCSGNWLEKLGAEIDADRLFIYLDNLSLKDKDSKNTFIREFNRALRKNITLFITPAESLPESLKEHYVEFKAH